MQRALDKVKPFARRMDGWFHGRLCSLSGDLGTRAAAVCCILLALTVPPLEFLPFVASAPMLAIATFGLAITVRDGILMLVGYVTAAAAVIAGLAMAMGG
jgi:hypothetical protein